MTPPTPPAAPRRSHLTTRNGIEHRDDWFWLADRDDPETIAYLEAENNWTQSWFEPLHPAIDEIFDEIRTRTLETDLSVPVRKGRWRYYSRSVEGQAYPIHCRTAVDGDDADGPEEILLDENAAAAGHDYFAVGVFDVSPTGKLLAWAHDTDGSERYRLRWRDLTSGQDLPDEVEGVYYSGAWSADDSVFFYVTPDEAMRPWKVWRHVLGTAASQDVCVFTENDDRFFVEVGETRSGAWVMIETASKTTSECWLVPGGAPLESPRLVEPRREGHEYSLDHQGDRFVVLTNHEAVDFKVMQCPVSDPAQRSWSELVGHRPGCRLTDVDAFASHLVISAMDHANEHLTIIDESGSRQLEFDETVYSVHLGSNPEYDTSVVRFGYESMVTPASVFDQDLSTGVRTLLKQQPVLGDVDLTRYRARREWAPSADGTLVPVDIVWHVDTPLDATAPALLYGYGSYEISMTPYFRISRLSLLDRGMVFAVAHPRGGGEMGRNWYLEGKLLKKRNTFDDMIACAEHLRGVGLVAPDKIVVRGGSAGGLLVGACVTMRPDLWAGAVAEVPFVDVVTTMLDASMPLTVTEWDEWGNPEEEPYGSYIASYAPYENVRAVDHPPMYVTAGLNDPRVSYHEPAKWVAKLRAIGTGSAPLLLHTEMGAGHGGPSGRYDAWRDEARTLAFVLWCVGLSG